MKTLFFVSTRKFLFFLKKIKIKTLFLNKNKNFAYTRPQKLIKFYVFFCKNIFLVFLTSKRALFRFAYTRPQKKSRPSIRPGPVNNAILSVFRARCT